MCKVYTLAFNHPLSDKSVLSKASLQIRIILIVYKNLPQKVSNISPPPPPKPTSWFWAYLFHKFSNLTRPPHRRRNLVSYALAESSAFSQPPPQPIYRHYACGGVAWLCPSGAGSKNVISLWGVTFCFMLSSLPSIQSIGIVMCFSCLRKFPSVFSCCLMKLPM